MTSQFTNPLDRVRVAAPCPAEWERMRGGEQVRFCDKCSLNVYNLSAMTKRDAETLVTSTEGRLCVRFYRRADGSILTQNCPVGLQALKRRVSRVTRATVSAVLGFLAGLAGIGSYSGLRSDTAPTASASEIQSCSISAEKISVPEEKISSGVEPVIYAGRMSFEPEEVRGQTIMTTEAGSQWEVGVKANEERGELELKRPPAVKGQMSSSPRKRR